MSDDPLLDGDDEANTSLAPEDRDGLIPSYITFRRELNEAEQVNIDKGDRWAINPRARHDVLTEDFIRALHKRMNGDAWRWAGSSAPRRAISASTPGRSARRRSAHPEARTASLHLGQRQPRCHRAYVARFRRPTAETLGHLVRTECTRSCFNP